MCRMFLCEYSKLHCCLNRVFHIFSNFRIYFGSNPYMSAYCCVSCYIYIQKWLSSTGLFQYWIFCADFFLVIYKWCLIFLYQNQFWYGMVVNIYCCYIFFIEIKKSNVKRATYFNWNCVEITAFHIPFIFAAL